MRAALLAAALTAVVATMASARGPARGYDTWDGFKFGINESNVLQQAGLIHEANAQGGMYKYFILDEGWSHADGYNIFDHKWVLDGYGYHRPNPKAFPSASGGSFAPLAAKLKADHNLTLGLWMLHGVTEQALKANYPVKNGGGATVRDIVIPGVVCPWHTDIHAINVSHPAGRAYYAGMMELYREWGVGYIKVDCIFGNNLDPTAIQAISSMVDPASMVYSLSPGSLASPALALQYAAPYADSYRMTNDLYQCWSRLFHECAIEQLVYVRDFVPIIGVASNVSWRPAARSYPDMDMLPYGGFALAADSDNSDQHRRAPHPGAKVGGRLGAWKLTVGMRRWMAGMWSLLQSPVVITGDIAQATPDERALLANGRLAAMHQDASAQRVVRFHVAKGGASGYAVMTAQGTVGTYVGFFPYAAEFGADYVVTAEVPAKEMGWPATASVGFLEDFFGGTAPKAALALDNGVVSLQATVNDAAVFLVTLQN